MRHHLQFASEGRIILQAHGKIRELITACIVRHSQFYPGLFPQKNTVVLVIMFSEFFYYKRLWFYLLYTHSNKLKLSLSSPTPCTMLEYREN